MKDKHQADNLVAQSEEVSTSPDNPAKFSTIIAECFGPNRKFDVVGSWKDEFLPRHEVTAANLNSLQARYCQADAVYDA